MRAILETDRLYLRQFQAEDAVAFFELNSDWDVIKYTGDKPFESTEEALEFIKAYDHYKKYGYGRWAVCHNGKDNFMGFCGLKYHPKENITEVGFRLFKKYWNNGFATESTSACIAYGFNHLDLQVIHAHAHRQNAASIRVLEKCGLKFVKPIVYDDQPANLYRLTKKEYESQ